MPTESETILPELDLRELPSPLERDSIHEEGPYVVILYNDDHHSMDEVIFQIQKATGYDLERSVQIMFEAHSRGRAIAYTGSQEECERAAQVLRQIRLQVETDKF